MAADVVLTPPVVGKSVAAARQFARLREIECVVGVFFIAPDKWRPEFQTETIYLQSPQPRTPIRTGMPLAAWTLQKAAREQRIVEMPDLVGLDAEHTLQAITDAGLTLMIDLPVTLNQPKSPSDPSSEEPSATPAEDLAENTEVGDLDLPLDDIPVVVDQYPAAGAAIYEGTSVFVILEAPPSPAQANEPH